LLLAIHAVSHWLWNHHVPLLPRLLSLFNRVVFATQLPAQTRLGKGVRLNYSGLGTVLHARAVVLHDVPAGAVVVGIPARVLRIGARSDGGMIDAA
jgi:serine O-acetyltransferase